MTPNIEADFWRELTEIEAIGWQSLERGASRRYFPPLRILLSERPPTCGFDFFTRGVRKKTVGNNVYNVTLLGSGVRYLRRNLPIHSRNKSREEGR